ncbi:glycosyltransferase [Candidatus Sumerlaeota bacterium]|nr:glycosyltransferase [Candidatus Sumerlaeota bacterium]
MILTVISSIILLLWMLFILQIVRGMRLIPRLSGVEPLPDGEIPSLTVIVPARDEERGIRACLESLLAQEHPRLEIIAVDDRSADATGQIMDEIARGSGRRLQVIHVTDLPEGWLGKCHALHLGAQRATGDLILFTDGDIQFAPSTLRLAVSRLDRERGDMLVVVPELLSDSYLERAVLFGFAMTFLALCPPWRVVNPRSRTAAGAGAFNLVRRSAYERAGGHEALRMALVDDLALAQLMKWSGGRLDMVSGIGQVRVRWQASMGGVVRGLEKNAFGSLGFSVPRAILSIVSLLLFCGWPWAGLLVGPWPSRAMCAAISLGLFPLLGLSLRRSTGARDFPSLAFPLGGLVMAWTIARSMVVTLRRGGVRWRGTFHPLRELRDFQRRTGLGRG